MIAISVLQSYYSRLGGVRSLVRVQSSRLTRVKILKFSVLTLCCVWTYILVNRPIHIIYINNLALQ